MQLCTWQLYFKLMIYLAWSPFHKQIKVFKNWHATIFFHSKMQPLQFQERRAATVCEYIKRLLMISIK